MFSFDDNQVFKRITTNIVIFVLIVVSVRESYLGLAQLLWFNAPDHYSYEITGSFLNSGPYGGFLSVCGSVMFAYYVTFPHKHARFVLYRIWYRFCACAVFITIFMLLSTHSRSAVLAFGCSILLLVVRIYGTIRIRGFLSHYGVVFFLSLFCLSICSYYYKKPSADGRLFMDKICLKAIYYNKGKGVGFGNFGGAYGGAQAIYFETQIEKEGKNEIDWTAINEHDRITADCPTYAFNDFLFVGVEAGVIKMLLLITLLLSGIVISYKRKTIWCYGLCAFGVFAFFYYPLHIFQFQILLPILFILSIIEGDKTNGKKKYLETAISLIMVFVITIIIARKIPEEKNLKDAQNIWRKTEYWHNWGRYDYVVEDCDSLFPYFKKNSHFLFVYGQSLNKTGDYEKSDSILNIGTRISSDPMFWNVMGNNSLAQGKYREAEERYKHAFYMVPNRLYPLVLLAKLYYTERDTARFLEMTDVVENFVPKVESIRTEKLRAEIRELKNSYLSEIENKTDE